MIVGTKYTSRNKQYTLIRVNETQVATFYMLEDANGKTTTVGTKVLNREYRRLND